MAGEERDKARAGCEMVQDTCLSFSAEQSVIVGLFCLEETAL